MREDVGTARRDDKGKLRWDLLPMDAIRELVRVYTFGSVKYEDNNWRKGMKWTRVFASLMRHIDAFWAGEMYDEESGLHHLAHAAWNCITLMWYSWFRPGLDDRWVEHETPVGGGPGNRSLLPGEKAAAGAACGAPSPGAGQLHGEVRSSA